MTDHATEARELLDLQDFTGRGYWSHADAVRVNVLRGIGHALLAIHEALTPPTTDAGVAAPLRNALGPVLDRVDDTAEQFAVCLTPADVKAIRDALGEPG